MAYFGITYCWYGALPLSDKFQHILTRQGQNAITIGTECHYYKERIYHQDKYETDIKKNTTKPTGVVTYN